MAEAKKIINSFGVVNLENNMIGSKGREYIRKGDWPLL